MLDSACTCPSGKRTTSNQNDLSSGTNHQLFSLIRFPQLSFTSSVHSNLRFTQAQPEAPHVQLLFWPLNMLRANPAGSVCFLFFSFHSPAPFFLIPHISFLAQHHSLVKCKGDETGAKSGAFLHSPHVCNVDTSFSAANSGLALSQVPK